jgi:ATP/maltotriose-dependent transcriptional regulator MalT
MLTAKRRVRRRTARGAQTLAPNQVGRQTASEAQTGSAPHKIAHQVGQGGGDDDHAILAVLVPVRIAGNRQEQGHATQEPASWIDWDNAAYALVAAASPAADHLRQIALAEHPARSIVGRVRDQRDAEQLVAAVDLDRCEHRLAQAVERDPPVETLSRRERDVLRLIAAGRSNHEIADALVVAVSTVKMHIKHIYSKLGVNNRVQAIAQAWLAHML